MAAPKGPGLYEFLIEAELQHYYAGFKNDLKVQNVPQLKYVTEDDLFSIGMSKPEMRRLKKFFQRHFPQNYLSKFKKLILSKKEENHESALSVASEVPEKPSIKVPNKHIIPAEAIVVNKELGEGEFGTVQQGVWTDEDDRIQVAIKCLSRERMQNNPIEFLKEAAIMHGIDHEHIVRLYGVVLDTNSLMLVTELAPLRSLLECLKEPSLRTNFPVLSLCDFSIQICDGMQYLEQKRLIHRDLAARNILVFSKNKVKISDFGLSRALGVGKDYYQTKFNVNLKLPIAWCAPECISYLKFTSASDVWAYGVTLWEMFSYGFQPWAALTGHQIWEAIDEPNFQRLEQPECCPREYYNVMMKCWQHDPNARPRFADLITILPECKPEQVQAVQDFIEDPLKSKREQLVYRKGDVITVLEKQQQTGSWKGVVNSGKTGWFNPANTVTYLGNNLPSNNISFTRGDGKNTYSSKRKIRPDMISGPQGDFKHTGHVGLDGAYFGDLSFLGGKTPNLPRQIVTPYRPHEDSTSIGIDSNQVELSRTSSDVSDCTPLLKTVQKESNWAEANKSGADHEYHEISDDEELGGSPIFKNNGPSLMDEMEFVFRSFGTSQTPPPPAERKKPPPLFVLPPGSSVATPPASPLAEAINVKNELKEMAAKAAGRRKQATVKPISAADEKTLDSAIAMANELTARSISDLDGCTPPESPHTPASPSKRKFSFRFPSVQKHASPKVERKNFAEQAACIPDIQALCDKLRLKSLSPTPTPPPSPRTYSSLRDSYTSLSRDSSPQGSPQRRGSLRSQGMGSSTDLSKSNHFHKNGISSKTTRDDRPLKLPPWDQASAEFYFARSRDLLSKIVPPHPQRESMLLSETDLRKNNFSYGKDQNRSQYYGNWPSQEMNGHMPNSPRLGNKNFEQKPRNNNIPSLLLSKEVPLSETSSKQNNAFVRKSISKGHIRRRSYTDRLSSTSSDSSDSDGEKQMSYRLKMRRQRRGGSFSHSMSQTPKGSQSLLSSPPPQNSFLNSVVSPKMSPVSKNKFYFTNFKSLTNDGVQHSSLNNICRQSYITLSRFDVKWPDKIRDSSSLTFTSSNSSTLNWEEYPELDRDFLSFSNCPPSPAPQSTISPEAKEVYSSLVEQPVVEAQSIIPASTIQSTLSKSNPSQLQRSHLHSDSTEANPLRMLRSGALPIVRPKARATKSEKLRIVPPTSLPVPPSQLVVEESSQALDDEGWRKNSVSSQASSTKDSSGNQTAEEENPIPLPPRDRSRPSVSNKPRHQRKHPLVIPGLDKALSVNHEQNEVLQVSDSSPTTPSEPSLPAHFPEQPVPFKTSDTDHSFDDQIETELDALDNMNLDSELIEEMNMDDCRQIHSIQPGEIKKVEEFHRGQTKANIHLKQKIAKLNQQALLYSSEDSSDNFRNLPNGTPETGEVLEGSAMRRHDDHVSCEDLLEFSAKSKSKSRGEDSDEVRLMSKVLGREMTSENCLIALNATDWDVYSAIKLAKLQNIMKNSGNFYNVTSCWDALSACDGDITKAASILISQGSGPDYV